MKKTMIAFTGCLVFMVVANCSQNPYGTAYEAGDARKMQQVLSGTIVKLNAVTIDGEGKVVGTVGGAAIGGILGSAVGEGKGSDLAAVAGGLLGGFLGHEAGDAVTKKQGVNLVIRLNNGQTVAIVQQVDPNMMFHVGDKVDVYKQGGTSRVVLTR